ncbi:hypothetical protein JCM10207_001031 [Rhodosporidiobolus poonsookiae]
MLKHESSSPESSGSTPSPPSSDSPPSSGSSPSPPRSAASPPHELVELSLAPLRRDDDRDGRTQRTVPCAQCRQVRRVCRWVGGQRRCETCERKNLECSGPQRRGKKRDSPVDVPLFPDEDDSDSDDDDDDLPLVSIGPASPNGEWMRLNLSYSLNSHLVNTCTHFSSEMWFGVISLDDFQFRFSQCGGKTGELSKEHELLASVCMLFGVQFTNHSGVLGSRNLAPTFSALHATSELLSLDTLTLGPRRHGPLREVFRVTTHRIEHLDYDSGDLPTRIQRIGLAWMALEPITGAGAGERHAIFGQLVQRALRLRDDPDCVGEAEEQLMFIIEGLALSEHISHEVARVASHARFAGASPKGMWRDAYYVTTLVAFRLFSLSAYHACLLALRRAGADEERFHHNDELLSGELCAATEDHHLIMNRFNPTPMTAYFSLMRLVLTLEPLDHDFLRRWANRFPDHRDQLNRTLYLASFFLPEAVRLITILGGAATPAASPASTVSAYPNSSPSPSPSVASPYSP